ISPTQDQRVPGVLPRKRRRDRESVRQDRRHVLRAVDGEIDLACQQRVLDFLDEESLATDLRQRRILKPIAASLDDDRLGRHTRLLEQRGHRLRLPERQRAASGAEFERPHDDTSDSSSGATDPLSLSPARLNSRFRASAYATIIASSLTDFNCSVGVSSSFSTMSRVTSSMRDRASGGRPASFGSSRCSSARRIASNRWRKATTVGTISRDCIHAVYLTTSSSTIASARASSAPRRVRFSWTIVRR